MDESSSSGVGPWEAMIDLTRCRHVDCMGACDFSDIDPEAPTGGWGPEPVGRLFLCICCHSICKSKTLGPISAQEYQLSFVLSLL